MTPIKDGSVDLVLNIRKYSLRDRRENDLWANEKLLLLLGPEADSKTAWVWRTTSLLCARQNEAAMEAIEAYQLHIATIDSSDSSH